jgi:hypothetical protein
VELKRQNTIAPFSYWFPLFYHFDLILTRKNKTSKELY